MTDAELAVLSLVAEGPQHGYQIQQAIEARGVREWAQIGFSSVYYILNKLEQNELLSSEQIPSTRGPARKVYQLTPGGRSVLQTAVADLLSTPHEHSGGFLMALANLHVLRPEQVHRALDSYESHLRRRVADLNERQQRRLAQEDRPLHVVALFDYSLHMALAELTWLAEFRQALAEEVQHLPQPPAFRTPVIRAAPDSDPHATRPSAATERLAAPPAETVEAAAANAAASDTPTNPASEPLPDDSDAP